MDIYKLNEDGSQKLVMFGLSEQEIDTALDALPKGRYFYFDESNTRIFSEKLDSLEQIVEEWVD